VSGVRLKEKGKKFDRIAKHLPGYLPFGAPASLKPRYELSQALRVTGLTGWEKKRDLNRLGSPTGIVGLPNLFKFLV
jgi:hypothetical protein